jgi:hypothetical protein
MYFLNGQPLFTGQPFTGPDGTKYPSNWLELSSKAERDSVGIVFEPDAPTFDSAFYVGYSDSGELIPKNHAILVEQYSVDCRGRAYGLLRSTDWMIIREIDNGTAVDPVIKQWRENVRLAAAAKITAIEATADTASLAAYITGGDYSTWPSDPNAPAGVPPTDGV